MLLKDIRECKKKPKYVVEQVLMNDMLPSVRNNFLLASGRRTGIVDNRGISFVTELKTQIRHACADCHEYKLLVYLVMNNRGQMFGVCKECGSHYSRHMSTA